jgi:hypothetical protein
VTPYSWDVCPAPQQHQQHPPVQAETRAHPHFLTSTGTPCTGPQRMCSYKIQPGPGRTVAIYHPSGHKRVFTADLYVHGSHHFPSSVTSLMLCDRAGARRAWEHSQGSRTTQGPRGRRGCCVAFLPSFMHFGTRVQIQGQGQGPQDDVPPVASSAHRESQRHPPVHATSQNTRGPACGHHSIAPTRQSSHWQRCRHTHPQ